jgi:hypothetical protein
MWNRTPRRVRCGPASEQEELSKVSGAHQGVALGTSALEAAGSAASTNHDVAGFLSVFRAAPLQAETRHGSARGSAAVDPSTAPTQPATSFVLVLPHELRVVRTAVRGTPSYDDLTRPGCECDLGSPVREICTPGSEWGNRYKEQRRLGEGTVAKATAPVRLRTGYRSKTCSYQPQRSALSVAREGGPTGPRCKSDETTQPNPEVDREERSPAAD